MKQIMFNFIIFFWLAAITVVYLKESKPPSHEWEIKHSDYDEFLLEWEPSVPAILSACEYYGLRYPRIVAAQAILESGNFNSRVFKEYNNPFGLYNSKTKDYYKFNHFTEAVLAYKELVESKYKGGDYYEFLRYLPYAEDEHYIRKIKAIESNLPP